MKDFEFHFDTDAIERSVRDSLKGLDEALAGLRGWQGGSKEIEQHFQVGPGAEIAISAIDGEVSVRGWSGNEIVLRAESDHAVGEPVQIERQGDRIAVRPSMGQDVEFVVTVPYGCLVTVNSVEADVSLQGTRGPAEVRAIGGDVVISRTEGQCQIVTGDGDVSCESLTGTLSVRTANGDVEVEESRLLSFELQTQDGDVSAETSLAGDGHYTVRSANGDVRLRLPRNAVAEIDLRTANGDISFRMPAEVQVATDHNWHGRIGTPAGDDQPSAQVLVQTVNGDIRIEEGADLEPPTRQAQRATPPPDEAASAATETPRAPEAQPAAPVAEAAPPAPEPEDRASNILRALERGEISVEEAMEQLDEER